MENFTFKRLISGALALLVSLSMLVSLPVHTHAAAAHEHTEYVTEISNDYLSVRLNEYRHVLYTTGGDPDNSYDNYQRLLYDATSKALLNINGALVVFSPEANLATPDGSSLYSYQYYGDIKIERFISFSYNTYTARYDTVEYKYVVTNLSTEQATAGVKFIFDTMLGSNDRAPFRVAGRDITTETTYEGDNIPQVWQVFDSLTNPSIVASGTFYTNEADKPDKVQFLTWGNAYYEDRWEYTSYGESIGDSGVTITFEPDALAPGESRTVKTFYGISAFTPSESDPEGEIGFSAIAPRELLLNDAGNGYLGNPFTFNSWVSNTGNATLSNVEVTLSLPDGLYTESNSFYIGDLASGADFNAAWIISATPERYDRTLTYSVTITSDGNDPITSEYTLFLPATEASPIRVEADRENVVVGTTVDVYVTTEDLPAIDALAIVPLFDGSVFEIIDAEWLTYAEIQDIDLEKGRAISAWDYPTIPSGQIFRFTLSAVGEAYGTEIGAEIITQTEGALEYLTVESAVVDAFVCYHDNLEYTSYDENLHYATCIDCGLSFDQEHSFETETVPPTCTAEGYTSYHCVYCGDTFIYDVIEAPGHNYVVNRVVEPDCVNYGYTEYICTGCGDIYAGDIIESPGHTYESEIFAPTCQDNGFTRFTCTACGTWYDDHYTLPIPHNYIAGETVEPTCANDGYTVYTCTGCGDYYTEYVPALDHTFEQTVVAPTCQAGGYTTYTCTTCGYSYDTDYVTPTAHNYVASETIAPTCAVEGYTVYVCSVCGNVFHTDYTPTIPHNYEAYDTVPPTCTSQGYTATRCTGCGAEGIDEVVEMLPHNYTSDIIPPTCINAGYTLYTCVDCGNCYTDDYVYGGDHTYEVVYVQEPSCQVSGYTEYSCVHCGDWYTGDYIDPLPHNYETRVVEPTCQSQGYTIYTCVDCGSWYEDDYVDPTDHNYETKVVPPTCQSQGYTVYICVDCGSWYEDDYVGTTDHNYETEVIAPTCQYQGYTIYTCVDCGSCYESDYVDPVEHNYETRVIEPTCHSGGYTLYTCVYCGECHEDNYIDPVDHSYDTYVVEPTCQSGGYTVYTCVYCGEWYEDNYIDPVDHNYDTYVVEPTCQSGGYTVYTCVYCGEWYESDHVGPTDHNYNIDVIEPDCYNGGYSVYTCVYCGTSYEGDYTEATGHNYDAHVVEPDCYNSGYTVYTCVHCGEWYEGDYVGPRGHNYDAHVVEPDCYNGGYTVYTCVDCGEWYEDDYVGPRGHSYDIYVLDSYRHTYICAYCGDSYEEYHAFDDRYDTHCEICGYEHILLGDMNDDGIVDYFDAALLLMHVFFPDQNPIYRDGDVTRDGILNADDAVYLQHHIDNPYDYPLD